jgi:hypothetical protein
MKRSGTLIISVLYFFAVAFGVPPLAVDVPFTSLGLDK